MLPSLRVKEKLLHTYLQERLVRIKIHILTEQLASLILAKLKKWLCWLRIYCELWTREDHNIIFIFKPFRNIRLQIKPFSEINNILPLDFILSKIVN